MMGGLEGLWDLVGKCVWHLPWWGWAPYIAGGVASDTFIY